MACSIVIPTRDRPYGLKLAVSSAFLELKKVDGEIIVIDDGSKISAGEILSDFNSDRLKIFSNPGLSGPSTSRNYGVTKASGSIVHFLDDDDQFFPGYCLSVQEKVLRLNPQVEFGFSTVSANSRKRRKKGILSGADKIEDFLTGLGCGFFIRRNVFQRIGGLDEMIQVNEDTEFCIRLKRANVIGWACDFQGVILGKDGKRSKSDRFSATSLAEPGLRAASFEQIFCKHSDFFADHRSIRRRFVIRILKYRLREKNYCKWKSFVSNHVPEYDRTLFHALGKLAFSVKSCLHVSGL
ncbi:MAG: glycosyltransferase family A protein [Albidovulum sp.]|nr:glycosyltransferase family A protein [Albidovulum sp.]